MMTSCFLHALPSMVFYQLIATWFTTLDVSNGAMEDKLLVFMTMYLPYGTKVSGFNTGPNRSLECCQAFAPSQQCRWHFRAMLINFFNAMTSMQTMFTMAFHPVRPRPRYRLTNLVLETHHSHDINFCIPIPYLTRFRLLLSVFNHSSPNKHHGTNSTI